MLISAAVPAFVLTTVVWVAHVPRDFGMVSGVLAALLAFEILSNRTRHSVVLRSTVYVSAAFCAYLFIHYPGSAEYRLTEIGLATIILLAIAIGAYVRITSPQNFSTTPTDYLIVFGVIAVALFGNTYVEARDTAQLVVYAVVLIYGSEAILSRQLGRWHLLNLVTLASLTLLAYRGLLT